VKFILFGLDDGNAGLFGPFVSSQNSGPALSGLLSKM
jgi:hypothetical protein